MQPLIRVLAALSIFLMYLPTRQLQAQEVPKSQTGWLDHWRLSTFSFGKIQKPENGREFFEVIGTGLLMTIDGSTLYCYSQARI